MGTRWSKGSELGVVAMTLGLAFACGGKYDIGTGDTGGAAGTAGSGEAGSGGSNASGQGGSDQGGSSTTGGRNGVGGDASGGTAGASAGGFAGASGSAGSSSGGSAGEGCDFPVEGLPEYTLAPADAVWERLDLFLLGAPREPFEPAAAVSLASVRSRVLTILDEQYAEDGRAPSGLENFFRDWALEGEEGTSVEFWASSFARGNFVDFFADVGGRVSFMSDRDFLATHYDSTRRGMWMMNTLFFWDVGLPPEGVEIEPVPAAPGKTRRQTVEETVSQDSCLGCHAMFDPLGFSLEHYDALGDYRTTENGIPIDASGTYSQASEYLVFSSIDDLAGQLPGLCEVQTNFARALFEYALDQAHEGASPPYEAAELRYVIRQFREGELELSPLLMAIATTPAFLRE